MSKGLKIGDKVRINKRWIEQYGQVHGTSADDLFTIAYIAPIDGRKAFYLDKPERGGWIAAWRNALVFVQRGQPSTG